MATSAFDASKSPREAQSPLYYLRSGATQTSSGVTKVAMSVEEARLAQLRVEHPEYNEFMLEMALYQEQQAARERNREAREEIQRKKEKRLAARLRAVDELVSLPAILDAEGKPAPLDKKAFAWLKQFHPELAAKWNKLVGLSLSALGPSSKRSIASDEEVEALIAQKEADAARVHGEHDKRKKEVHDAHLARLAWLRAEHEKRSKKANEERIKGELGLKKLLKDSESHEAAVRTQRDMHLRERTEALRLRNDQRQEEHQRRARELELASQHGGGGTHIEERLAELQARREQELIETHVKHEMHMLRVRTNIDGQRAEAEEKRQGLLDSDKKSSAAVVAAKAEMSEIVRYHRGQNYQRHQKVLSKNIELLQERLNSGAAATRNLTARVEVASIRRHERLMSTSAVADTRSSRSVSPRDDAGDSSVSPRYAQPTGQVSARRQELEHAAFEKTAASLASPRPVQDDTTLAVLKWKVSADEAKFAAGVAAVATTEKEVAAAAKRRAEYCHDYVIEPSTARIKHEAEVRRRHEKQVAQSWKERTEKIAEFDSRPHCFVPRPPRVYKGPRQPKERELSPRTLRMISEREQRSPARPDAHQFELRDAHLAEVQLRAARAQEEFVAHKRHAVDEKLARDAAASSFREDNLRHIRDSIRSEVDDAEAAAAKRRREQQSPRTARPLLKKISAATARSAELRHSAAATHWEKTYEKCSEAAQRRHQLQSLAEAAVEDDISRRAEQRANAFRIRV